MRTHPNKMLGQSPMEYCNIHLWIPLCSNNFAEEEVDTHCTHYTCRILHVRTNFPISFIILKYRNRRNATIYHSFLLLWLSELCWILSQDNLYQYKKTSFSYHLKTFQTQKLFNHWHHCRRFHHWHHWHRFHQCHHRHQGHRCHCCLERNQIATKKKGDFYQILVRKLNFQLQKIWNVNLGNNIDICVPGAKSLFQLTWFWFSKSHWVLSTVQTNSKMEDICFHPPSNIWKLSHTLQ